MKHFFRLIRVGNLAIVALTMYLMRHLIIEPSLRNSFQPFFDVQLELQFGHFHFFLLVLSTVLITAAGYVINDYFDRKTDLKNKPEKVVVSTHIPRRTAMTIHWTFNAVAVLIGVYLSIYIGVFNLSFIFLFSTGLLWYYSTSFSKEVLVGNVIVALLTAMVPMLVVFFELPMLYSTYGFKVKHFSINFNQIVYFVFGFSLFAFITTLVREIIKDIEDAEGDRATGRNTLPIVAGTFVAKLISILLILATVAGVSVCTVLYVPRTSAYLYTGILIIAPSIFLAYRLAIADTAKKYHFASQLQKIIMLAGLLFSVLLYFIISSKLMI